MFFKTLTIFIKETLQMYKNKVPTLKVLLMSENVLQFKNDFFLHNFYYLNGMCYPILKI